MMILRLHAPGGVVAPVRVHIDDRELTIVPDGPARLVDGGGRPRRLRVLDVGDGSVTDLATDHATLVYSDRFGDTDLDHLRRRRSHGIDRAGQIVVSGRDLSVVVQRPRSSGRPAGAAGLAALRATASRTGDGGVRGPVTARLVQHLLEQPAQRWSPTELAAADGATTIATASRLLAQLLRLGLATVTRDGRWARYRITEPALLLDWLGDRREGRARQHLGYLRARDVEAVVHAMARGIEATGLPAVLTGPAAALLDGAPTASALGLVTIRVATGRGAGAGPGPAAELAAAARDLGLTEGAAGANVRVVDDVGLVGTHRPRFVDGVPLAGPVRVWLDLRAERRGSALADLYREQVVDPLLSTAP